MSPVYPQMSRMCPKKSPIYSQMSHTSEMRHTVCVCVCVCVFVCVM